MPRDTGSFIFGLTFGALCGVVMALLLTPQSGEETRELLGKKTDDLKRGAEDAVGRARESTAGFVERGRSIAEDAQTRLHGLHTTEQPEPEPQPELQPERAESQVQV